MKKWNTRKLVEAGIMLALSMILSQIKVYRAINGGSVTAGSMIPVMIFAMRWGASSGIIVGASFGILKMIFGGWIYSPIQAILEYPMAFGFLGLAGIFSNQLDPRVNSNYFKLIISIFMSIAGRFICHLLAGVIFFGDTLPEGINVWYSSALYQSTYLIPEFIISVLIFAMIWKPLTRIKIEE